MSNKILGSFLILIIVLTLVIIIAPQLGGFAGKENKTPASVVTPAPEAGDTSAPEISREEAEEIAIALFPETDPESLDLIIKTDNGRLSWEGKFLTTEKSRVLVLIDGMTGEVFFFSCCPVTAGRPDEPVVTMEEAYKTARDYLMTKTDGMGLVLTEEHYKSISTSDIGSVAGNYDFRYSRLIRGVSSINDGYSINVDAVSGTISVYHRSWDTDEADCRGDPNPSVSGEEAKEIIQKYLSENYEEIPGLEIQFPVLWWADQMPDAGAEVPLAWKVSFDCDLYRSQNYPWNASGWVDAHSGEVLVCNYYPEEI